MSIAALLIASTTNWKYASGCGTVVGWAVNSERGFRASPEEPSLCDSNYQAHNMIAHLDVLKMHN
jgi:hypothetical protein